MYKFWLIVVVFFCMLVDPGVARELSIGWMPKVAGGLSTRQTKVTTCDALGNAWLRSLSIGAAGATTGSVVGLEIDGVLGVTGEALLGGGLALKNTGSITPSEGANLVYSDPYITGYKSDGSRANMQMAVFLGSTMNSIGYMRAESYSPYGSSSDFINRLRNDANQFEWQKTDMSIVASLSSAGDLDLDGDLDVGGNIQATDYLDYVGTGPMKASLGQTWGSSAQAAMSSTGALDITTLTASGDVDITGTLDVGGAATFASSIDATGWIQSPTTGLSGLVVVGTQVVKGLDFVSLSTTADKHSQGSTFGASSQASISSTGALDCTTITATHMYGATDADPVNAPMGVETGDGKYFSGSDADTGLEVNGFDLTLRRNGSPYLDMDTNGLTLANNGINCRVAGKEVLMSSTLAVSSNKITPTRTKHKINTSSGAQEIYGIAAGTDGQQLTLSISDASFSCILHANHTSSTSSEKLTIPSTFTFDSVEDRARIEYDSGGDSGNGSWVLITAVDNN